jgi:hypothetical protein
LTTELAKYRYNIRTRRADGGPALKSFLLRLPDVLLSFRWVRFAPTSVELWVSGTDRVVYSTVEDDAGDLAALMSLLQSDLDSLTVTEFQRQWGLSE